MSSIKIPDDWSGEDALVVVGFLDEVVHAIWTRHGSEMGHLLELQQQVDSADTQLPSFGQHPDFAKDDIPF